MIRVEHVAMVNLLAGRAVVARSCCRPTAAPDRLAATVLTMLRDPAVAETQRAAFGPVLDSLRPGAEMPSAAAAREVLAVLDRAPFGG